MNKDKDEQMTAKINEGNEMILIESRTMRDKYAYRDEILEKVKVITIIPNTTEVTIEMAANYYDVSDETVKSIIKRHRAEFNDYGEMRLLKGKSLKEFCEVHDAPRKIISSKTRSATLINRRGLLRIGMLLTESEIAQSIRNYLLNVEEISDDKQKLWAVEREISKRERRQLTDAIQDFYEGTLKKGMEYATFTNLVYKVIFDLNAVQLKKIYEIGKNEYLRDAFSTEDLRKIVKAERSISVLLLHGKDYHEIKNELMSNADKYK